MKFFFQPDKNANLSKKDRIFKQDIPRLLLEIIRKYFRLEIEGLDNVPKKGAALLVPNHSGFTAIDAVMIGNELYRTRRTIVRMLAHPLWFLGPNIRILAKKMGLVEASKKSGEKLLSRGKKVIIFPEGEKGNFKPTYLRYKLQEFRRGFVRMAMSAQAPIIPTVVIGAEETNINLSQLKIAEKLRGIIIPIPLNVLPLPAKWKIIFLKPVDMSRYTKEDASNIKLVHRISESVKNSIQKKIDEEIQKREWIYFPKGSRRNKSKKQVIKEQSKQWQRKITSKSSKKTTSKPRKKKSKTKVKIVRVKAKKKKSRYS